MKTLEEIAREWLVNNLGTSRPQWEASLAEALRAAEDRGYAREREQREALDAIRQVPRD